MSGKAPLVYWDTSAFIAFLKGENSHGAEVVSALRTQAGAFDRKEIILATSSVGISEVLATDRLDDTHRDHFEQMTRRSNFREESVTNSIAKHAARLKKHCYNREKESGEGNPYLVMLPDAIHIVTAMLLRADVLVTLDRKNKPVEAKRREMGMIQVAKHLPAPDLPRVPIEFPALGQPGTSLDFGPSVEGTEPSG